MADLQAWGVDPGYHDYRGAWRDAPPETVDRVLRSMGQDPDGADGPPAPAAWVVLTGQEVRADGRWLLETEDGGSVEVEGCCPPDVPPGYHWLRPLDGGRAVRLVVAPPACFVPDDLCTWGWAVQLYATRSRDSWGIGDLADLRRLAAWSASLGAGMLLTNPLHASLPTVQQPSPYYPSSRCFRNPIYLRVEGGGGAGGGGTGGGGTALNASRLIDRDAVWRAKRAALEARWQAFEGDPRFDRFLHDGGDSLHHYATFCAISEEHGVPWMEWPEALRHPSGAGVRRFAAERAGRVRFHAWLQWLVEDQLAEAGAELALMQDVAVGCDPAGADAWLWQDTFALDMRVGAPPDEFNTKGQDWGLPPFDPWKLRSAAYEPYIRIVRSGFRHAGGVRIDHVMGLFRLFWIPQGEGPGAGTYVRYPWQDMLRILALESHRAGAYVVGEDLGTVEDFMRDELRRHRILSYRLLWFEPVPPKEFPAEALAAVTTHDLPTVAGLWSGSDLDEQHRLGLDPNVESTGGLRSRLEAWGGLAPEAPVGDVVQRTYELLAEAPSRVVTATLDDALGVEERPNVPGTTDERPNWSYALPVPLDDLERDPAVLALAGALRAGREQRGTGAP